MSNIRSGRGFQRSRVSGIMSQLNTANSSEGSTIPTLMPTTNNLAPLMNSNTDTSQQDVVPQSRSGVIR